MTKAEKQNRLDTFIRTNFAMYEDGVSTLKMLALVMGEADLLAEFNYFAEERQDKEDFVETLASICYARAEEYNEQADRLRELLTDLRSKNSYECGDRPKINY
jgi:hypothetical protein